MKYLIYMISFLFIITFAGCDNVKAAKVDAKVTQEAADVEKDTCKDRKSCKRKNKKECKEGKSCKHKCDKDKCKEGKHCKSKPECDKSKNAVKEHKCGEGKCGGDNSKKEITEETDN